LKKPLITCLIIGSLLWGICPAVLADEPTEATQENTVTEDIATDDSLTQDTPMNNTSNENVPNENALTANTETEESPQKHGINYYAGDHTTYYTDYSLMNDEFPNADIRFTTVGFELARGNIFVGGFFSYDVDYIPESVEHGKASDHMFHLYGGKYKIRNNKLSTIIFSVFNWDSSFRSPDFVDDETIFSGLV
jgi:hypothetical protein